MPEQKEKQQQFVDNLLTWYKKQKRDLPWRKDQNPYYIWVSEIMLQQTRVDTVIPYFQRFIERFPTLDALAEAPEEEVLKHWEGLGYYSRARNLHAAVKEVKSEYGSVVPNDPKEISKLKGIGPYTAGAVLSIAYNVPEPAVDGNVMRVLSRYFLLEDNIAQARTRVKMEHMIREMIPHDNAGDFNQAMMELGALVCTPKSPRCDECPVHLHCEARKMERVSELPIKTKAKKPRPEFRSVAWIIPPEHSDMTNCGSGPYFLIRQRPAEGLLARMWELPHVEVEKDIEDDAYVHLIQEALKDELQLETSAMPDSWLTDVEHTFSHIRWHMKVYRLQAKHELSAEWLEKGTYRWISFADMNQFAFPKAFLMILRAALDREQLEIS